MSQLGKLLELQQELRLLSRKGNDRELLQNAREFTERAAVLFHDEGFGIVIGEGKGNDGLAIPGVLLNKNTLEYVEIIATPGAMGQHAIWNAQPGGDLFIDRWREVTTAAPLEHIEGRHHTAAAHKAEPHHRASRR